jgi:hypothetical protein
MPLAKCGGRNIVRAIYSKTTTTRRENTVYIQDPSLQSVYICDDVIPDPVTGRIHLIGIFDTIRVSPDRVFPYVRPTLYVFVRLSDAEGRLPAYIQITRADTTEAIFQTTTRFLQFPDRRTAINVCFRLVRCEFPLPGVYFVEFYCNDRFLQDRVLTIEG